VGLKTNNTKHSKFTRARSESAKHCKTFIIAQRKSDRYENRYLPAPFVIISFMVMYLLVVQRSI